MPSVRRDDRLELVDGSALANFPTVLLFRDSTPFDSALERSGTTGDEERAFTPVWVAQTSMTLSRLDFKVMADDEFEEHETKVRAGRETGVE